MMRWLTMSLLLLVGAGCGIPASDVVHNILLPEARTIDYRDPSAFPEAVIPESKPPKTVAHPRPELKEWRLSLNEAIRIGLENGRIVRILTGVSATASGQTVYDAAITQTTIDQAQGRFDPTLSWNHQWSRTNSPFALADFTDFTRSRVASNANDAYLSTLGLTQTNVIGGSAGMTLIANPLRYPGGGSIFNPTLPGLGVPLNPQTTGSVAFNFTQPLLQGAGYRVNTAPIVIARLNTEISFFQYKDSVQELVRGIIEAYWNLVQAGTDVDARQKQVDLSKFTYERELARLDVGLANAGDVAQAKVSYTQFEASLIAAKANQLTREGALRNILGLPPSDDRFIVPVSRPSTDKKDSKWEELVQTAEMYRPDIIELKIIIEAEQQRLLQAENQMLPKLDALASYQWNGLTGIMPNGESFASPGGKYANWTLGINFSVPLGLRQGRAQVRQERLLIERDRANLDQALHNAIHELSSSLRDLDSAYAQYKAYQETKKAAEINMDVQKENFDKGRSIYLNYLQALNDWGTAVSAESLALVTYNVALATLERRMGTILEQHGLVFQEERFRAAAPIPHRLREYPSAIMATGTPERFPAAPPPDLKGAAMLLAPAPAPDLTRPAMLLAPRMLP